MMMRAALLWRASDGHAYRSTVRPLLAVLVLCKLGPPLAETVIDISKARTQVARSVEWRAMQTKTIAV